MSRARLPRLARLARILALRDDALLLARPEVVLVVGDLLRRQVGPWRVGRRGAAVLRLAFVGHARSPRSARALPRGRSAWTGAETSLEAILAGLRRGGRGGDGLAGP